jgi:transposase
MDQYAGIDVSLALSHICIVDSTGAIIKEAKVPTEPVPLIAFFRAHGVKMARIGLEAGPLSQWLYRAMQRSGFAVELLETRHVRDAFRAMPVKTDRNDARAIAQLMRLGWFRPVHCKSAGAQEVRALLGARKALQTKRIDIEMSLRGMLRGFGLKVGQVTPRTFGPRILDLVDGHQTLRLVADSMLKARETLEAEIKKLSSRLSAIARRDTRVRLLMTAPGVGALVALTYVSSIDDPSRFKSSRAAGAYFGLTPKKYQSGERDVTGRITKIGDGAVRFMLFEAANAILTRPMKSFPLRVWAQRLAARAGGRKAKVALARRLAVILHRMLADGVGFINAKAAAPVMA